MGKKMFFIIVAMMTISLIGIITVQVYWIDNIIVTKREQFKNDVKLALAKTSEIISDQEFSDFKRNFQQLLDSAVNKSNTELRSLFLQEIDTTGKEKAMYSLTVFEALPTNPGGFSEKDSLNLSSKRFTGKKVFAIQSNIKKENLDFAGINSKAIYTSISRQPEYDDLLMKNVFQKFRSLLPVNRRINNHELKTTLKEEFAKRNIDIDFKYGVYSKDGYLTNLKSGYYTIDKANSIGYPLLINLNAESNFTLYVTFPDQKEHILSGISTILMLSVFFIFIIILAFSGSLYQLLRQKKISEIKSDFINNMTHEFKTPIATINLAIDAIINPKIINDNEKVTRYANMIREENKRMHGQVENVLRISRLEKNQLEINKTAIDMHDVIEDAISHVDLLVTDKDGSINTHLEALRTEVFGNQMHLTSVVVNILENALKYADGVPTIEVKTASTSKNFILKIKDNGIGMSKNAQKYVFNKFYREHKGNVHNVKGHGLGLAYVKEIVENHHGTVFVQSEKGVGSTFTVELPLI